jgi:sugar O-acyltransferase (sialic acid O-acetyltransferase NeuD family)
MINIYGKGGHARMIASLIEAETTLYDDSDYQQAEGKYWIIGIGDNNNRKKIAERLKGSNFILINTGNTGTYVAADIEIGIGVVIAPGSVIQNNVSLGNHVIINTSASVDHDCVIGDYCHIAPNSTLCGAVKIGQCTIIGAGSVILPGIEIGENCIIGAGSVVTKNIPSNSKAYGNPAKIK